MYVKVKIQGRRAVYLSDAVYVSNNTFITGYQIDKYGDQKIYKGGAIRHLIQLGKGVTVVLQKWNLKYAELEDVT